LIADQFQEVVLGTVGIFVGVENIDDTEFADGEDEAILSSALRRID